MSTWFPTVTIEGEEYILVLPEINWRTRPKITHTIASDIAAGRTGIEARAALHPDVRLSVEYLYTFEGEAAEQFGGAIRAAGATKFLLPLWPDKLRSAQYESQKIWDSSLWMNCNPDTAAFSIGADTGLPYMVGLGIFSLANDPKIKPKFTRDGKRASDVSIKANEDRAWSARIGFNYLATPTWYFEANWLTAPEDGYVRGADRQRLGNSGLSVASGEDIPNKRCPALSYSFIGRTQIREALSFWLDKKGTAGSFPLSLPFSPTVEETLNARFAEEDFMMEFRDPAVTRARINFIEELTLIEGQPPQEQPTRAYLLKVWWDGAPTVKYWAECPHDIESGGNTYLSQICSIKTNLDTLGLGQGDWEVLIADFEGNPLRAFKRLQLERKLRIEIRDCRIDDPEAAELVFVGEIKTAPNQGPIYTAQCALFGGVLKNLTPNHFCKQGCNATIYDEECGVDPEDFKVEGTLVPGSGTMITVNTDDASASDYFTYGYAEFGAGDDRELRWIMRSEPVTGGQQLWLNRPLWISPSGTAVKMYPGCDLQYEGGCAKFDNQPNFEGDPYKPAYIETVDSGFKTTTGK